MLNDEDQTWKSSTVPRSRWRIELSSTDDLNRLKAIIRAIMLWMKNLWKYLLISERFIFTTFLFKRPMLPGLNHINPHQN